MPGLVKVGKTTTAPHQRMAELHSTGVPTPFKLEFSLFVDDCHREERRVHGVLAEYRNATNREFFRLSPARARDILLATIEEISSTDFGDEAGRLQQTELKREREYKRQEARRQEQAKKDARGREARSELSHLRQEIKNECVPEPSRKEVALGWLARLYSPLPIGWIFWVPGLALLLDSNWDLGTAFMLPVLAGFLARMEVSDLREKREAPSKVLRLRAAALERELASLGLDLPLSTQLASEPFTGRESPSAPAVQIHSRGMHDKILEQRREGAAGQPMAHSQSGAVNLVEACETQSGDDSDLTEATGAAPVPRNQSGFQVLWEFDSQAGLLTYMRTGRKLEQGEWKRTATGFEIRTRGLDVVWAHFFEVDFVRFDHPLAKGKRVCR